MAATRGRFITFEGLDGSGKTTQLQRLAKALRQQGISVVLTREPGGTDIGEKVRSIILDSRTEGMAPPTELALMFASRAQHVEEVIAPAVAAGKWVLCDRFTDSSEAYQGFGRQLGSQTVLDLHRLLCKGIQPDLTILLWTEDAASVERARHRNRRQAADEGRFEAENTAFYRRVRDGYLRIAQRDAKRISKIPAKGTVAKVHSEILKALRQRRLLD
jgi:dTMP kinase